MVKRGTNSKSSNVELSRLKSRLALIIIAATLLLISCLLIKGGLDEKPRSTSEIGTGLILGLLGVVILYLRFFRRSSR